MENSINRFIKSKQSCINAIDNSINSINKHKNNVTVFQWKIVEKLNKKLNEIKKEILDLEIMPDNEKIPEINEILKRL